jgi:hypothetical protein
MMRLDITQLISHQSKMLTDFAHPKNWRGNFHEAQSSSEECFKFDQYKTVAGYRTSQAQARTWKRSTRITLTLPHDLTAAIAKWRMLQPGRPKRVTAIVELKRRWVGRHDGHP